MIPLVQSLLGCLGLVAEGDNMAPNPSNPCPPQGLFIDADTLDMADMNLLNLGKPDEDSHQTLDVPKAECDFVPPSLSPVSFGDPRGGFDPAKLTIALDAFLEYKPDRRKSLDAAELIEILKGFLEKSPQRRHIEKPAKETNSKTPSSEYSHITNSEFYGEQPPSA